MGLLDDKMRVWLESAKFVKAISGVYVLYNRNKEPIFIGETNNLETTFTKYFDTEFEGNKCMQKTSSYQRVFTNNQKQEQIELMEQFKNETGKYPSCNSEIELKTS
jgi:excinuclease UvrABC nuclease subunit